MYCGNCGTHLPGQATSCPACGAPAYRQQTAATPASYAQMFSAYGQYAPAAAQTRFQQPQQYQAVQGQYSAQYGYPQQQQAYQQYWNGQQQRSPQQQQPYQQYQAAQQVYQQYAGTQQAYQQYQNPQQAAQTPWNAQQQQAYQQYQNPQQYQAYQQQASSQPHQGAPQQAGAYYQMPQGAVVSPYAADPMQPYANQAYASSAPAMGYSGLPTPTLPLIDSNRSVLKLFFLSLITCGIYYFYFIYQLAQDVNRMCMADGSKTGGLLAYIIFSYLTCGIYPLYWEFKIADRLQRNAPLYGLYFAESGTTILLWYILGSFLCGIGPFVALHIIIKNTNALAMAYNSRIGRGF